MGKSYIRVIRVIRVVRVNRVIRVVRVIRVIIGFFAPCRLVNRIAIGIFTLAEGLVS